MARNLIGLGILAFFLSGTALLQAENTWDIYASEDTWIEWDANDVNYGSAVSLELREESEGTPRRAILLQWDLRGLAGATIDSVELHARPMSATATLYPKAYLVQSAWDEYEATYTKRTATEDWATPGGDISQNVEDYVAPIVWNVYVGNYKPIIEGGTSSTFNTTVQNWVDDPDTNYGIMIKRPYDSGARAGSLASRESGSAAFLRVTCTNCEDYVSGPYECGDPGTQYLDYDYNTDCYVNLVDFAVFAGVWLQCTDPAQAACDQYWR